MSVGTAPRRRRRRWPLVLLVVLLVLAVLAAAAVVLGDRAFRSYAEGRIEQQVGGSLPKGVRGGVTAVIHGRWALLQYLHGDFDRVTLTGAGLTIGGAPASALVQVHGLPVDGQGAIGRATGVLTVGAAAFRDLPALEQAGATAPVLREGRVSTSVTRTVLGVPITVAVGLTPALRGQVVRLTPATATLTAGPASIPAIAIVRQLFPDGIAVCAASSLPRGVRLTAVHVHRGAASASIAAKGVTLAALQSGRTGTCS